MNLDMNKTVVSVLSTAATFFVSSLIEKHAIRPAVQYGVDKVLPREEDQTEIDGVKTVYEVVEKEEGDK